MLFPCRLSTIAPRLLGCQRRSFFMPPSPPFTSIRSSSPYTESELVATDVDYASKAPVEVRLARGDTAPRLILTSAAADWFLRRREEATESWELKDPQGLAESTWIGRWIGAAVQGGTEHGPVISGAYELQKDDATVVETYSSALASVQPE